MISPVSAHLYVSHALTAGESSIDDGRFREYHPNKSSAWMTVRAKDHSAFKRPALDNSKSLPFNPDPGNDDLPCSEQADGLRRWIKGPPANQSHAILLAAQDEQMLYESSIARNY